MAEMEKEWEEMKKLMQESGNNYMTEAHIKTMVHENQNYFVSVVRMPDMSFDTYGIINKETGVIEQLQPNLYNATYIADQFDKWLVTGPTDEDEVESILAQFSKGGSIN